MCKAPDLEDLAVNSPPRPPLPVRSDMLSSGQGVGRAVVVVEGGGSEI